MSTKKTEAVTAAAPATTALATRRGPTEEQIAALKAAGIDVTDESGKEVIDGGDIVPPFVAIAQKTHPQLDPSEGAYIEGLKFGEMFNSMTRENYGTGPLEFVPVALKKHAIEFTPWDDGGGIVDRNVPWDDERCEWNGDEEPKATRFYDFVVAIGPDRDLAIISCKVTSFKAGKNLATLIATTKFPMYLQKYTVSCAVKKNDSGSFGVFSFQPNGVVTNPSEATELKALFDRVKAVKVVIDHEAERPDTPAATDAPQGGDAQGRGDNIPF